MKIIQIIKDGNKLIGLGDDGITYVQSKIKYSFWNEKIQEEQSRYTRLWREITDHSYESNEGIYYINAKEEKVILEEYYDKVISDDFNYENDIH